MTCGDRHGAARTALGVHLNVGVHGFLELERFIFAHHLHERINTFGSRARRAGIGHLQIVLIARIKQISPLGRGLHLVLFQELGVGEEAKRNQADTGPVVVGITIGRRNRIRVGRTVGFQNAFRDTGGIHVSRAA